MLDEVRALLILQDRDRRLLELARDLEKLPQEEARARAKLAGDEAAVKAAHDALIQTDLKLKKLELDAGTRKTTIARLKTQQFETRKNEEFQALGHEVSRYEKELDELETKELEVMEEMDAARARQREAEQALAKTKSIVNDDLAAIATRGDRLRADAAEVKAERETLAAAASPDLIPLYERLMKTKNGLALAPMNEGKCGGCHMKLIASTIVAVQSAREIARCEDCGRILYAGE